MNRDSNNVDGLINRLISQMDMVYDYIINNNYDDTNNEWILAKELFINLDGYLDGSSSYGLVFNGEGISSSAIGEYNDNTYDITLTNVEVKGISLFPKEKFKLQDENNNDIRLLFGDTIDCLAVFDQIDDMSITQYINK